MAKKLELTKMPARISPPQWRKIYRGQTYYFRGTYSVALRLWHEKKDELDGARDLFVQRANAALTRVQNAGVRLGKFQAAAMIFGLSPLVPRLSLDAADEPALPQVTTTGQAITLYLNHKNTQAEGGSISAGRAKGLKHTLEHFKQWHGEHKPITDVNSHTIDGYWSFLNAGVTNGQIKDVSARDRMKAAKQLIRWCWERDIIETLPKTLSSREIAIKVTDKAVVSYSLAHARSLLKTGSAKFRLCVLLALNIGGTQKDLADLKWTECDLERGTIRRRRSKTSKQEGCPVVTYALWPETVALLRQEASERSERVLGLAQQQVTYLWERDLPSEIGGSFKLLRKTGASLLESHADYGRYAQYYLGHAPASVAERHYAAPNDERLADALEWLRGQLFETR